MDDAAFLAEVRERLTDLVHPDLVVTAVRLAGGRPWPRTEVILGLAQPPPDWHGPTHGPAYLPSAEEWRYASGCEDPADYAQLLAEEVDSAAYRLFNPPAPSPPPTPDQVRERWHWLLERLELNGPVREVGHGRLVVTEDDGASFTVLVTPEEWARIGEPLDPGADDPQDFNHLNSEEAYLVYYEGDLVWSIRPELPPVRWGAELRRQYLATRARGRTTIGWYASNPTRNHLPSHDDPE